MIDAYIYSDEMGFKGELLDQYLSLGYYRMRTALFTTNQIFLYRYGNGDLMSPVFWIRTVLTGFRESKASKRIRKNCAYFNVLFKPAEINNDIEDLFSLYKERINFDTYASCRDCMLDTDQCINPFNSWMIEIWDDTTLIAVGYFDIGEKASMAIINFYHPNYSKYSLGKFLMLKTLDFCKQQNMKYYYPGYICTADNKMDYKLFPDTSSIEVLLPKEKVWHSMMSYSKQDLHAYFLKNIMRSK